MKLLLQLAIGLFVTTVASGLSPCKLRLIDHNPKRSVCVCNSTYCDDIAPFDATTLKDNEMRLYTSTQLGKRLKVSSVLSNSDNDVTSDPSIHQGTLEVNPNLRLQKIIGFGGAFTDAAGINIAALPNAAQTKLIQSYFGQNGIQYTIGRIPMASCDFSTHVYSYDDSEGDFSLSNFSLAPEDIKYKIPFIQQAQALTNNSIKLFGSPWAAPAWMKTTGRMHGNGTLIGVAGDKYHKTWANYFVKFLQAYANHSLPLWGLTVENEPTAGFQPLYTFQAMGFSPETERDFVKSDLGPALEQNGFSDVKVMIVDDQRFLLPNYADVILRDADASKYVSGIAVHWYEDMLSPVFALDYVHGAHPNKFILATEACTGALPWEIRGPDLGNWFRAEKYAADIIEDLNHWVAGWTDWNLALNEQGGPNWVKNYVDSPIIVNKTGGEFYKQPMFYALGHFSKFVRPDSVRIPSTLTGVPTSDGLASVFLRPDNVRVAVVLNRADYPLCLNVTETGSSKVWQLNLEPHSITTALWKAETA